MQALSAGATYRLLAVTFTESLATILLQRGLYFYTTSVLGFNETENLWLAFVQGLAYAAGALLSHPATARLGERRTALMALAALAALHGFLVLDSTTLAVTLTFPVIGLLQGIKWPIIESFASGGRGPRELLRLVGRYNVTWALAVPVALALSGWLIDRGERTALFALAALLNVFALFFVLEWPPQPGRLEQDHPERPDQLTLTRYDSLVSSARWTMVGSYTLLFLLAPLMPSLLGRHGLEVGHSTLAAALLDVMRLGAFAVLGFNARWQGRSWPLAITGVALPLGFFMVLIGPNLATVLAGEVLFGAAAGVAYYASLYYALLVKNASVDAGGAHEGLIGLGFALGPLAGLAGQALTFGGGGSGALLATISPIAALCLIGAFRPLWTLKARANTAN
jgi:predicted MFS family arabinose efflux permease